MPTPYEQAHADLNLSPQEKGLYERHLANLNGPGKVVNPDKSISTLMQMGVQGPDGLQYNIPSVYNGKVVSQERAIANAAQQGWYNFPAYPDVSTAESRYQAMHQYMGQDVQHYQANQPRVAPELANQVADAIMKNEPLPVRKPFGLSFGNQGVVAGEGVGVFAGKVSDALADPRNAWMGLGPKLKAGAEIAGSLGAAMPIVGMFAGPKSKTADLAKLTDAIMQEGKVSGEAIRKNTGWFRGVDNTWQYEISDHLAKLHDTLPKLDSGHPYLPMFKKAGEADRTMGDVLHHPELYNAYPQLRNAPVKSTGLNMVSGAYEPSTGTTFLSGGKEMLGTTLHEQQHAVQYIEGMAPGGSSSRFLPANYEEARRTAYAEMKAYENVMREDIPGFENWSIIGHELAKEAGLKPISSHVKQYKSVMEHPMGAEYLNKLREHRLLDIQGNEAFQKYESLIGETQARNVTERMGFLPETRKETPPFDTMRPPPAKQILK